MRGKFVIETMLLEEIDDRKQTKEIDHDEKSPGL